MTKADLVAKMANEGGITKAAAERALKCVIIRAASGEKKE
jgi:nucleoid DNA-binding protein